MTPLPNNPLRLYNTSEDIETSVPYATEDAVELELVIHRFVGWAQMIATRPNIAAQFGDRSRDHIQLATDLRKTMESRRHSIVVLPMSFQVFCRKDAFGSLEVGYKGICVY